MYGEKWKIYARYTHNMPQLDSERYFCIFEHILV